jgi:hypothetical protein
VVGRDRIRPPRRKARALKGPPRFAAWRLFLCPHPAMFLSECAA